MRPKRIAVALFLAAIVARSARGEDVVPARAESIHAVATSVDMRERDSSNVLPFHGGTTFAVEFLRLTTPTVFGIGVRYFAARVISFDVGLDSLVGIRSVGGGVTLYPLLASRRIRVTPIGSVGMRRFTIDERFNEALGNVGIRIAPELELDPGGTSFRGIEWRAGLHVQTRAGFFVEASYGTFIQLGRSRGGDERTGVELEHTRFRLVGLSFGKLLDFRGRR